MGQQLSTEERATLGVAFSKLDGQPAKIIIPSRLEMPEVLSQLEVVRKRFTWMDMKGIDNKLEERKTIISQIRQLEQQSFPSLSEESLRTERISQFQSLFSKQDTCEQEIIETYLPALRYFATASIMFAAVAMAGRGMSSPFGVGAWR